MSNDDGATQGKRAAITHGFGLVIERSCVTVGKQRACPPSVRSPLAVQRLSAIVGA